ncbi:MAG: beta-lactamase family protein, partial [Robiginitomaculum sp.]|nr:beta-lactamase family protein [Robiginitomaculum sp.]
PKNRREARMKLFIYAVIALVALGVVYAALNWSNIQRLLRVNSLFDEDKIVHNFSNMDGLLHSTPLPISGTKHIWTVDKRPLPETFIWKGGNLNVQAILDETKTTAFVVVKDGTIVSEDYYLGTGIDDKRISWSMSKSFVSSLVGVALASGDIKSLDDQVTDYAPSLKGSAYEGATLRNVLHMASGVKFNEDYLDKNSDINKMGRTLAMGGSLDVFAANVKDRAREPGTIRQYCSIDTHVISMVLRAATGETLQNYFLENLWSKMGAGADAWYNTDSEGNAFALGGLNMRTRDYALFGELFRNGGKRGDDQIIPADWVAESTKNTAPKDVEGFPPGYGYQWWTPPNADGEYFAVGVYGQYIYVNPKAGIVIAKNSAHRDFMNLEQVPEGHILRNLEMFRGVAEHYSDWQRN